MPSFMFLEPKNRQIEFQNNIFDERQVLQHADADIAHVLGQCQEKLGASAIPHTIVGKIMIDVADKSHLPQIIDTYTAAIEVKNTELRNSDIPIHLSIKSDTQGAIYFVAGYYEPIEKMHMQFPYPVDLSGVSQQFYEDTIRGTDFAEREPLLHLIPQIYDSAARGEVNLKEIVIDKDEQGNLFVRQQGPTTVLQFDLTEQNYLQMKQMVESRAGKTVEELVQNPEELFRTVWETFNTAGEYRFLVKSVNGNANFSFASIREGDEIAENQPDPRKKLVVGKLFQNDKSCKRFIGSDGKPYSIYAKKNNIQLYENFMTYDNQTGTDIRFPNQTWEEKKGDCDEVVAMMVAFLKKAGYEGQVSMATIEFVEKKEGHAFLLNFKDNTGTRLMLVDPTAIDGIKEITPVVTNGEIDWKKTAEAAYKLNSGKYTIKNVSIYSGFGQIAAYCYETKSKNMFNELTESAINNVNGKSNFSGALTDAQFSVFKQTFELVQNGLEEDNNNVSLLSLSSQMKIFCPKTIYSKYGQASLIKFLDEAEEESRCAVELEPNTPSLRFIFAQTMEFRRPEIALEQMSKALEMDRNNVEYYNFFKLLLKRNDKKYGE